MNDSPGWASPGSAPDGQGTGSSGSPGPEDLRDRAPQWSKEQPPPGQWSSPGAPAPGPEQQPGPAAGWGGQQGAPGGWGGQWNQPPAAAKPGVIPLRPLGVGEILDGAVSTMRTYWRTVLGISLAVAVVTEVAIVLLQGLVLNDNELNSTLENPDASLSELYDALGTALAGSAVVGVVTLLGMLVATAMLTMVISRAVLGRSVSAGEAWRSARPRLLRLLGLTLVLPLIGAGIVTVGVLPGVLVESAGLTVVGLLAAAVVALWLMIRFSLASPALMLERQGITKSMSRSAKLVRGSWWRVFGIQLLATVIAYIISAIIAIPFTVLAILFGGEGFSGFMEGSGGVGWTFLVISGIGAVIGSTLTFPITAGVVALLYIDQRIRREALDLELARAAGLTEYGTPADRAPGS
ncbi:glycerophosphoryl diester phosphodiesterase membrane domain-containing protein [Streptomyces sp. GC420]|uniref:glycerophosphoryl diester phosphodiesterase membrane domain-containing protein n=1 Tax=Streptomyces sp. GC420 TaxID=2697568 RepID=UPI001414DA73|nr:glycerophosphoryl diester phosphodiesterase membrane domain-containing protein [Streptomyces sp. GC420]NBM17868.1 hypothetical protein [Streptomyces sp. GC420]